MATKKVRQIFFHPFLLLLFLNPGSGIDKNLDPGSRINIPDPEQWSRDINPPPFPPSIFAEYSMPNSIYSQSNRKQSLSCHCPIAQFSKGRGHFERKSSMLR